MPLPGQKFKALNDALIAAFDLRSLAQMLRFELSMRLDVVTNAGALKDDVFNLIEAADREGWVLDLVRAARISNPKNPELFKAAQLFSFTSTRDLPPAAMELEKIVRKGVPFLDPAAFRSKLGRLELQVCSIELDEVGYGSGVLVGPDYVLTNQHVVASAKPGTQIACRFDFAASANGQVINSGFAVPAKPGLVDSSPPNQGDPTLDAGDPTDDECDYALLQLETEIGNAPAGSGKNPSADVRGWVKLAPGRIEPGDPLFVLQHPQNPGGWTLQPLKFAPGQMLELAGGGRRLRHSANTLPGSSGSPCFSAALTLVALHHAGGDTRYKSSAFNQAIPTEQIINRLTRQNVTQFWRASPPEPAGL